MKWSFIPKCIDYDGSQLASHFAYTTASLVGDSIVAFIGACNVHFKWMVDVADLSDNCEIISPHMLHFIAEYFDNDLNACILRQRVLVSILQQEINLRLKKQGSDRIVQRSGDDLFVGNKKLTISVATTSPVSCLIHLGVNISVEGVPVEAIGLSELIPRKKVEVLAASVMKYCIAEEDSIREARALVRGVDEYRAGD